MTATDLLTHALLLQRDAVAARKGRDAQRNAPMERSYHSVYVLAADRAWRAYREAGLNPMDVSEVWHECTACFARGAFANGDRCLVCRGEGGFWHPGDHHEAAIERLEHLLAEAKTAAENVDAVNEAHAALTDALGVK